MQLEKSLLLSARVKAPLRQPVDEAGKSVRVLAGEYRISDRPDTHFVTVLGSCVAACVRHRRSGRGGLNHFMLPRSIDGKWDGQPASPRYGNFAMDALIREVLSGGGDESELEVKIFGGADVAALASNVGRSNVDFILDYLASRGLVADVVDVGGTAARKLIYTPSTGRVLRRLLPIGTQTADARAEFPFGSIEFAGDLIR